MIYDRRLDVDGDEFFDPTDQQFLANIVGGDTTAANTAQVTPTSAFPEYILGLAGVRRPIDPLTGLAYQTEVGGAPMLGWFGQQLRVGDGVVYEGDRPVFGLSGNQVLRALPSQYGPSIVHPTVEDMSRYTPEALVGWTPPAPAAAAPTTPTVPAWQPLAETLTNIWQQAGIDPVMSGINRAEELAKILTNYGITDLSKLGLRDVTYTGYEPESYGEGENIAYTGAMLPVEQTGKQLTYGDQAFGYLGGFGSSGQEEFGQQPYGLEQYLQGPNLFAWSAAGHGNVSYRAVQAPNGQVYLLPEWNSSSDWGDFRQVARLAATLASAGGAGAALGASLGVTGAAAQAAVGNAILSGIATGDVKGAALGGLGGLLAGTQTVADLSSKVGDFFTTATGSAGMGAAAAQAFTGMAAGLPGAYLLETSVTCSLAA